MREYGEINFIESFVDTVQFIEKFRAPLLLHVPPNAVFVTALYHERGFVIELQPQKFFIIRRRVLQIQFTAHDVPVQNPGSQHGIAGREKGYDQTDTLIV